MPKSYRFGPVEVRTVERQVLIEGRPAALGARAFDVLLALIERRGRLVTKGELLDIAWAGLVVEENNLQVQISTLRKLLGPGAFATIPGRGYRFAMALEGEEPVAVAADTPEPGRRSSNLPAPVDELIGRDADVLDLTQLVASHRLVTVLGAGGIGKTRLALEVARGTEDEYEDGVWWSDLSMVTSPERVAPAIANAVAAQLGDGDASSGLARALAQRRMLLVLDNCEHLAGAVAQVARVVLDAAPGLRILTTSQEALKLPGECLYRLETLAVPPAGTLLNRARTYSAIQLLEQRARAIDRRFVLDSTTIADAIELCRHVDGIALAIEMAAARLPTLGFGVLNARLSEGLRLLRAANRDTAPRYRTMQATVDWSHSLLGQTEQALLRRLSVFVGSFQLASAQRVACGAGIDEWDALDALGNLADKSLVQVSGNDPPRYRLLEPTRLYALERLAEHGELPPTLQLHGEAMAELSNSAEVAFGQLSERAWRGRYADDFDDCEAAFERACKRHDAEIAAATSQILTRLDLARSAYATVRRRKEAALALIPHADQLGRARLWSCVSSARLMAFNGVPRLVAAQEEVAAWKGIGDRYRHYDSLCRLAVVTATSGAFDAAEKVFEEALALEDPHWPARMRLALLQGRSVASAYRGDAVSLREECQALSALALLGGSERLAALGRLQLAEVAVIEGDVDRAIALGRLAVDEMRSLDLPLGLANSLATLCGSHLASGDLDSARSAARDALPIAHQNGVSAWLFDAIALLAARTGHHESAARMLGFADARYAGIQEIRRPWDKLAAGKAATAIAEVIGAPELARLRIAGSGLSFAEADALAWQPIDDLTEATP